MKRICLFISIFYFALISANGQVRFTKFYDYNRTANFISDVVVLGDTGYFTVSQCVDFKEKDTLNYQKTYLYLIRTSQFGDTVFTKVYNKPRFNIKGTELLKTKWGYLIAGEEYDLKKYHEIGLGAYLNMLKINEQGDTISTRKYDIQTGNDISVKIIPTIDSGYAVFGQTCNQIQSGKKCNYFLLKLDGNGNKQWHQIYKQSSMSFENPNSVIQLLDGTFYLFGQSTLNNGIMKWFLVKTDSAGKKLWQKTYNEYPRQAGLTIIDAGGNGILLGGSYSTDINGGSAGVVRGCAMLIDTSGNIIWSKSYGSENKSGFTSGILNSQCVLFSGYSISNDSTNNGQGWLMVINLKGDSLFQRLYNINKSMSEQIYNINKTSDGFLMSGYGFTKIDTIYSQDAWLLKVDSFGCLTPGCQLVGIDNIPMSREEIKIYPNPAKDYIQFKHSTKIISYRIADYTGKLLLAGNYLESGINVENLPSGVYIVQILLKNKSQAFGKLIIEK
jgi:hypothetical protein